MAALLDKHLLPLVQQIFFSPDHTCYQDHDSMMGLIAAPICFKLILAKLLGYLIIVGSMLYKLPQIFTILRGKSAGGLSLPMYLLEIIGFTITFGYNLRSNNPFSTYGENVFMILSNVAIIVLIFKYSHANKSPAVLSALFLFLYTLFAAVITVEKDALASAIPVPPHIVDSLPTITMEQLSFLQILTIPLFALSRIPQIYSNYSMSSTGALSGITCMMQLGGNLARLYTTLTMVEDPIILYGFLISLALNGTLFAQVVYYSYLGFGKPKFTKEQEQKKKKQ